MSVAQVNVGFQVKIRELETQMKKANDAFKTSERSFKAVGSEFQKTGQMVSQINPEIGQTIGRFGELGGMLPQIGKELTKLNLLVRANPWGVLAGALTAAGVALAYFASRVSDAAKQQKLLNDIRLEAEKNISKEIVQMNVLLKVARDETRTRKERLEALKAINQATGKNIENLTLETIKKKEATAAIDQYVEALRREAMQVAVMDKASEISKQIIELELRPIIDEKNELEKWSDKAFEKVYRVIEAITGKDIIGDNKNLIKTREELEKYLEVQGYNVEMKDKLRKNYEVLFKSREKEMASLVKSREELMELAAKYTDTSTLIKDAGKKTETALSGTIKAYKNQIEVLQKYQNEVAKTPEEYNKAADQIAEVQKKIDAIIGKRDELKAVEVVMAPKTGTQQYYDDLLTRLRRLRDEQELGSLVWQNYNNQIKDIEIEIEAKTNTDSFKTATDAINNLIETSENEARIREEIEAKKAEKAALYADAVSGAFDIMAGNFMDAMNEGETALDRFGAVMMQTAMKLISIALAESISYAIKNGSLSAAGAGLGAVVAQPAFIATAVGGVLSAFAAIPKFADGGIAYGPTLGLMGEYAGAANNPEVIAPLDKLKSIIGSGNSGDVHISLGLGTKISGSDLDLIIERAVKKNLRSR